MRLIDADKLLTEFKERAEAAKRWQETAKDEEIKIRAAATLDFLTEVKLTIEKAQIINPFFPIPAETMYKIMDSEFEASNSFWIETPKGKKIEFQKVRPRAQWIPFNYDNIDKLEDHCFYLVATTFLNTPVVAKYHSDGSPHFEIMPYGGNVFYICDPEITHFMELPGLPKDEEGEE